MTILRRISRAGVLAVVIAAGGVATPVAAQVGPALGEARARMACGAGTLVSATYVGGGMMRVTCSQPDQQQQQSQNQTSQTPQQSIPANSPLAGTGLATPVAAGVVLSVITIAIVTGNGSEGTTTTTEPLPEPLLR
jgi:hypothetical protein